MYHCLVRHPDAAVAILYFLCVYSAWLREWLLSVREELHVSFYYSPVSLLNGFLIDALDGVYDVWRISRLGYLHVLGEAHFLV